MPDQIYNVKWNGVTKKAYVYDGLGRITSETVYPVNASGTALQSAYTYKNISDSDLTTTLVSEFTNAIETTVYAYDENGNISMTSRKNPFSLLKNIMYEYDVFNQLICVKDSFLKKAYHFEYDDRGNITSYKTNKYVFLGASSGAQLEERIYAYTNSVWGDLLTSYNDNTITYDDIGNPLTYKNGETMKWQNGRQLGSITKEGKTTTYTYNANGQRTSKTVDGVTTEFIYAGDILAGQVTGDNALVWMYDNNGKYIGFTYNGEEYYYIYSLQGDVVGIADSTGTIIAKYIYDPWGAIEAITDNAGNDISTDATHIANINSIRYRGYYYDTETGFYYLKSRYYDPEICRFINEDGYVTTGQGLNSFNMFAYCGNNPINRVDYNGNHWYFLWLDDLFAGAAGPKNDYSKTSHEIPDYREPAKKTVDKPKNKTQNKSAEQKVIDAKYVSSYKGKLVVKLPIGQNAASFGIIFLGNDIGSRNDAIETVKHEYGHTVQFDKMGVRKYSLFVALPSVILNVMDRLGLTDEDEYYSIPWEQEADLYGGVDRSDF